jgi:hypothetical protein
LPTDLNLSNRPVRTRTPGGVAGDVDDLHAPMPIPETPTIEPIGRGVLDPRLRGDDIHGTRGYLRYPNRNSAYPFAATSSHLARYAGALPL